jgi:hypothetical protein
MRRVHGWVGVGLAVCASGCWSNGIYRTARTLEPGEVDVELAVSGVHFAVEKVTAEAEAAGSSTSTTQDGKDTDEYSQNLPNLVPELGLHVGVFNDFEFGGRVALGSMMLELDAKYRIIGNRNSAFHLALQPAFGYRTLFLAKGYSFQAPLIATYEFTENVAVNLAGYGGYQSYSTNWDLLNDYLGASSVTLGGSLGLKFSVDDFYFMPAVDLAQTQFELDTTDPDTGVDIHSDVTVNTIIVGLNLGFVLNRDEPKPAATTSAPPPVPAPTSAPASTP